MKKFSIFNFQFSIHDSRGVTLFIAIVIMGILLFISFAVVNIAIKSTIFASSGRDSQLAFYAADAGLECALYWDNRVGGGSAFSDPSVTSINCGSKTLSNGLAVSGTTTPLGTAVPTLIGAASQSDTLVSRVNVAGAGYTDSSSKLWSADTGFSASVTYQNSNNISGTVDDTLYQSYRAADLSGGYLSMSFTSPSVAAGTYNVNLKWSAAHCYDGKRQRVSIDGVVVENSLDVYLAANGCNKALDRSYQIVKNSSGPIVITFTSVVDPAFINAIEIVKIPTGSAQSSVFGFSLDSGNNPTSACAIVTVFKDPSMTYIKSRGYNTCDLNSSRRIERGVEVTY